MNTKPSNTNRLIRALIVTLGFYSALGSADEHGHHNVFGGGNAHNYGGGHEGHQGYVPNPGYGGNPGYQQANPYQGGPQGYGYPQQPQNYPYNGYVVPQQPYYQQAPQYRDHDYGRDQDYERYERAQPYYQSVPRFDDHHRDIIRNHYYNEYRNGHCPPGLIRRHGACVPNHYRSSVWAIGQPLQRNVVYYELAPQIVNQIGYAPQGYRYVRVGPDILMIDINSNLIVDAINDW